MFLRDFQWRKPLNCIRYRNFSPNRRLHLSNPEKYRVDINIHPLIKRLCSV